MRPAALDREKTVPKAQLMHEPVDALRLRLANLDERIVHLKTMCERQGDALATKLIAHTENERAEILALIARSA